MQSPERFVLIPHHFLCVWWRVHNYNITSYEIEDKDERHFSSSESSPSRRARIAGRPITPPRDFDDVRGTTSILR